MESKCEHCGEVHGVLLREEKRENVLKSNKKINNQHLIEFDKPVRPINPFLNPFKFIKMKYSIRRAVKQGNTYIDSKGKEHRQLLEALNDVTFLVLEFKEGLFKTTSFLSKPEVTIATDEERVIRIIFNTAKMKVNLRELSGFIISQDFSGGYYYVINFILSESKNFALVLLSFFTVLYARKTYLATNTPRIVVKKIKHIRSRGKDPIFECNIKNYGKGIAVITGPVNLRIDDWRPMGASECGPGLERIYF
ncbi:hypothetical protein DT075_27810 [Bacillus licheniformis]|nr:hypothetical protein DT075_27810 [Bacillus licheniformis]